MAKAEVEFAVTELVSMVGILNAVPWTNRGMAKLVDGLAAVVELTAEERETCKYQQQEVRGQLFYQYETDHAFTRSLTEAQKKSLLHFVENPPEEARQWNRNRKAEYESIIGKLGGEALDTD